MALLSEKRPVKRGSWDGHQHTCGSPSCRMAALPFHLTTTNDSPVCCGKMFKAKTRDTEHSTFYQHSLFLAQSQISVVSTKKVSSFEKGSTLSSNNSVSPTVLLKGSMSRSKHDCCVQKWGHFLACFQKSGHTTSHTHMSPQFFYTVYPASSCSG